MRYSAEFFTHSMSNSFLTISLIIPSISISLKIIPNAILWFFHIIDFLIKHTIPILILFIPEITMKIIISTQTVVFDKEHIVVVWVETLSLRFLTNHNNLPTIQTAPFVSSMRSPLFIIRLLGIVFVVFAVSFMQVVHIHCENKGLFLKPFRRLRRNQKLLHMRRVLYSNGCHFHFIVRHF